ncbi:hypothetical protein BO71DRAFT_96470 [Aspergillus ellipticus CBS 707.79]|uniref:Uncharacterized protein n=1 Tax=Aspergillus ellipticus CBS 707.79 TaxID=1448320 RepID=A0A319EFY1_9EURO|nr:hypothetical protein BO71DRAFT_96470 [Aspergillus ellipticus CBS 707.79]
MHRQEASGLQDDGSHVTASFVAISTIMLLRTEYYQGLSPQSSGGQGKQEVLFHHRHRPMHLSPVPDAGSNSQHSLTIRLISICYIAEKAGFRTCQSANRLAPNQPLVVPFPDWALIGLQGPRPTLASPAPSLLGPFLPRVGWYRRASAGPILPHGDAPVRTGCSGGHHIH